MKQIQSFLPKPNIQTRILARILQVTGYRFSKEGFFGRDGTGRLWAWKLGLGLVQANCRAGLY